MIKRLAFGAVFICICLAAGALSADRVLFLEAESSYLDGEYAAALETYNAILRDFPLSERVPDAQYRRAVCLFRLNRLQESIDLLTEIEKRFQQTRYIDYVPFWQGLARHALGDYVDAAQDLDRFLQDIEDPDMAPQALLYKSLSYIELGDYDNARKSVLQLDRSYPESELRFYGVAFLTSRLLREKRFAEVLDLVDSVDMPAFPPQWRERLLLYKGEAAREKGDSELAEEVYGQLVDASAEVAVVAFRRLYFSAQQREDVELMETILRGAEVKFGGMQEILANFWLQAGIESLKRRQLNIAEYFLDRVWSLRTDGILIMDSCLYLSEVLVEKERVAEAIAVLEEYLTLSDGTTPPVLMKLGNLFLSLKDYDHAAHYYGLLLEAAPHSPLAPTAGYYYALARFMLGELNACRDIISDLLRGDLDDERRRRLMRLEINALVGLGEVPQALATSRDYVDLFPRDIRGRLDLIRLLFMNGNFNIVVQDAPSLFSPFPAYATDDPEVYLIGKFFGGLSSLLEGMDEEAAAEFSEVSEERLSSVDLDFLYPYVLYYSAWAQYKLGRFADAAGSLEEMTGSYDGHELQEMAIYLAGWSFFKSGVFDRAAEYFSRLSGGTEELNLKSAYWNALSLVELKRYRDASVLFEGLFRESPEFSFADDALLGYARALRDLELLDEATQWYRELPMSFPESNLQETALFDLGRMNFDNNLYEQAREVFDEYRRLYSLGEFVDGALYYGGLSAFELEEAAGAQLLWEKLIDEYADSDYRPKAMVRTAEIHADREDYSTSLKIYLDYIANYPEEAKAREAEKRASELRFLMLGSSKPVARLESTIEREGGSETPEGRQAMVELSRLYILEGVGDVDVALIMLTQVVESHEPASAAAAQLLIGEYYAKEGDRTKAAEEFVKTLDEKPPGQDLAPRALYRAAEMMKLEKRSDDVIRIIRKLQEEFPDTGWAEDANKLLEGLE